MYICFPKQICFILTSCRASNERHLVCGCGPRYGMFTKPTAQIRLLRCIVPSLHPNDRAYARSLPTHWTVLCVECASNAQNIMHPGQGPCREHPCNRWRCVLEGDQWLSTHRLIPSYVCLRPLLSLLAGQALAKTPSDVQCEPPSPQSPLLDPRMSCQSLAET